VKNWKTTASGVLSAAGVICQYFGIPAEVGNAISVVGLFLLGLFSKDSNVTGWTVTQNAVATGRGRG